MQNMLAYIRQTCWRLSEQQLQKMLATHGPMMTRSSQLTYKLDGEHCPADRLHVSTAIGTDNINLTLYFLINNHTSHFKNPLPPTFHPAG
jgi:hypothetical protein